MNGHLGLVETGQLSLIDQYALETILDTDRVIEALVCWVYWVLAETP